MATKRRVYIVGGHDTSFINMFHDFHWDVVDSIKHADMVQFTGGEDITPFLYDQAPHPRTHANMVRDKKEAIIFQVCLAQGKPMAGVCRGGQFLNVMCGGSMWQDVDNHSGVDHVVFDTLYNRQYMASSTHHQQMIASPLGLIIGTANVSRRRERMPRETGKSPDINWHPNPKDVEVVFYEKQKCFCFQPHPELPGYRDLANVYKIYLDDLLFS